MNENQSPTASGVRNEHAAVLWLRQQMPTAATVREFAILLGVTTFLLLYGLIPVFGGDQLGLVGADEPRYAQIAREMLAAHSDTCHAVNRQEWSPGACAPKISAPPSTASPPEPVTPVLYGKPGSKNPPSITGEP